MWLLKRMVFRNTDFLLFMFCYSNDCKYHIYLDDANSLTADMKWYQYGILSRRKGRDEQKVREYKDKDGCSSESSASESEHLSIYFGEDKTKSILFANNQGSKNVGHLNNRYNHINIK